MNHHPTLPPSSYPAWAQCPHWESRAASETPEAAIGTRQHQLLAQAFAGEIDLDTVEDVPSETLIPVRRAYNGLLRLTVEVLGGEPDARFCEHSVGNSLLPEMPFGTLDYAAYLGDSLLVADYKSFATEKEHWEQLAFYAYAFRAEESNRKFTSITLAVWYGDTGAFDLRTVTPEEAYALVLHAIANRLNRAHLPRCSGAWCSLCADCGACSKALAIVEKTNAIVPPAADGLSLLPVERLPLILTVCAEAKKRIRAVESYAKQVAADNGGALRNPDGSVAYELKERARSEIEIQTFYDAVRDLLKPPQILGVCTITKTAAKSLLKGKRREGRALKAKEIDAIIEGACVKTESSTVLAKVRTKEG